MRTIALLASLLCASSLSAQIKVAERYSPYDPIVIESPEKSDSQSVHIWDISQPAVFKTVDGGRTLHVWAKPGRYTVKLTVITVGWEQKKLDYQQLNAQFEVGGASPTPDNPTPDNPDVPASDFKGKVQEAAKKIDAQYLTYAGKVGNNYTSIAAEAATNPDNWDAAQMHDVVKSRNTEALDKAEAQKGWQKFWGELANAFKSVGLVSNEKLEAHVQAFNDIGDVLKKMEKR